MPFKKCFVLTCPNTSENCENKLFILIPNNKEIRTRWFSAVNRPFTTTKEMYCCEDHFDLEVDMENWMQFKLIGSRVHMKKEVFPHKFVNEKKPDKQTPSQLTPSSRKRKMETLLHIRDSAKKRVCFDEPSAPYRIPSMSHLSATMMAAELVHREVESLFGTFTVLEEVSVTRAEDEISAKMTFDTQYNSPNMSKPKCKFVDKKIQNLPQDVTESESIANEAENPDENELPASTFAATGNVNITQEEAENTQTSNPPSPKQSKTTKNVFRKSQSRKRKMVTSDNISSISAIINKLDRVIQSNKNETGDEFETFAKHIAVQLRQMPLYEAIICQEQIQTVITEKRLEILSKQYQNTTTSSALSSAIKEECWSPTNEASHKEEYGEELLDPSN